MCRKCKKRLKENKFKKWDSIKSRSLSQSMEVTKKRNKKDM